LNNGRWIEQWSRNPHTKPQTTQRDPHLMDLLGGALLPACVQQTSEVLKKPRTAAFPPAI
jgi:hypothetical protein